MECPTTNNFDGFIDDDMSDIIWHKLLAARVDKNILPVVGVFRHDNLGQSTTDNNL
jgi:hypothetical protein